MQTLREIRSLLKSGGTAPSKRYGQNFLIDAHAMERLVDLADISPGGTILEVGAATGSLTEDLLEKVGPEGRVVAVEIDRTLAPMLRERLGRQHQLVIIEADVLAGKHQINPEVLTGVAPRCQLVANLPYNIATPLVAECMLESWRSLKADSVRFESLTCTVQQEVAERFAARGGSEYGIVSVLLALLGEVTLGAGVPATAFWPRPKIATRMVRVDFRPDRAGRLESVETLMELLRLVFTQRRKRLGTAMRSRSSVYDVDTFAEAAARAGVDATARPDEVAPEGYLRLANALVSSPQQ